MFQQTATLEVQHIGGIDNTTVELTSGITVLAGRNATNRTSLLRSIMAVMGSDDAALKADAKEGQVKLNVGNETYERMFTRTNGSVTTSGDPFLDDAELADLFAFLLESNEARRSVARSADLRELIMRPVDTASIHAQIQQLEQEKSQVDDELEELESLKSELPDLERERSRLEAEIEAKKEELATTESEIESLDADIEETQAEKQELESRLDELRDERAALDRVRSDIELQEESIQSLTAERRELESELADLPEAPMGDRSELESQLSQLRDQKATLESEVSDLQDVIQFNEQQLEGSKDAVTTILDTENATGSVTDTLVDDTVVCWTCGSEVAEENITSTLDQLRDLRQEKLEAIRSVESELSELKNQQQEYEQQQQRRDSIERKLADIETELSEREAQLDDLRDEREQRNDEIEALEAEIETLESEDFSEILDLHKDANQLEFEISRFESDLDDLTDEIAAVEEQLTEEQQLQSQRESIDTELKDLRTRIDDIEQNAVKQFNEHIDTVLEILGYDNLDRIWIERVEREVREGRKTVTKTLFELHVVRSTDSGAAYEDTIDHLSESEREVTGLIFALAGYLVHDVYEDVPFMLLDSLEAIDSERIAALVEYMADYPAFLIVALLPEDAQALADEYTRVTEI